MKTTRPSISRPGSVAAGLSEGICLVVLLVIPAFFNLSVERIFEEEKALFLRASAILLLGLMVAGALAGRGSNGAYAMGRARATWWQPIVAAFALFAASLMLASFMSLAPYESWMGAYYRRHGVATWGALMVVFLAMATVGRLASSRERLLYALVVGSLWPSAYAVCQVLGWDPIDWTDTIPGRAGSTMGNALLFGGYLAVVLPLTAFECLRLLAGAPREIFRAARVVYPAALTLQAAALVASGSRGPILAVAVGMLAGTVAGARLRTRPVASAVAAAIVVVGLSGTLLTGWSSRLLESGSGRVRILIWDGVWQSMREARPRQWLVGFGPETLRLIAPKYYDPEIGRIENTEAMPDRAHNEVLDTLVSAGVLGVAAELVFLAAVLWCAARIPEGWRRAGLLAAAAAHVVEIQLGIATVMSRLAFLAVAAVVVNLSTAAPAAAAAFAGPVETASAVRVARRKAAASKTDQRSAVDEPVRGLPWLLAGLACATAFATLANAATPHLYLIALVIAGGLGWRLIDRRCPANEYVACALAGLVAVVCAGPVAITPSTADRFSRIGRALERRQEWPAATDAYRAAAALQPREPYYLAGLGRTLIEQTSATGVERRDSVFADAQRALARALALNPLDPYHSRNLASLARRRALQTDDPGIRQTFVADADRHYAAATTLAPRLSALWVEWGNVAAEQGQLELALQRLDQAERLDPRAADVWILRGAIHARGERFDAALAAYDRALALSGTAVAALRGRAVVLTAIGRLAEARAAVDHLLQMAPADAVGVRLKATLDASPR